MEGFRFLLENQEIFLILLVVLVVPSINIVRDHERIAVFRLNEYHRLRGPGFVMSIPLIDRSVKIALDDKIELVDRKTGMVRRRVIPVAIVDDSDRGEMVRVIGFEKGINGSSGILTSK